MQKLSKKEAEEAINEFFSDIGNKTSKEVKKIKKLAMRNSIKLKDKRKLFCRKCFTPYKTPSIRIKNDLIRVACENCEYVSRWKVK
jgi:RNase P subunit RPR2